MPAAADLIEARKPGVDRIVVRKIRKWTYDGRFTRRS
jgi:hypothetical protein